jgi:hydrogenase expression/formation protein HypE
MLARAEFELGADVESDTRSLWPAVDAVARSRRPGAAVRARRDARRRGLRAQRARPRVRRRHARARGDVPVSPVVAGAAELLGIDPMHVANEGKLVAIVAPEAAAPALEALRGRRAGEAAADIGEVRTEPPGMVLMETAFGGRRVLDMLVGDPLPRIC